MMKLFNSGLSHLTKVLQKNSVEYSSFRFASASAKSEQDAVGPNPNDSTLLPEEPNFLENEYEAEQREALINKKRNKSRLYPQHQNMIHDRVPYTEENSAPYDYLKTVRYNRRMYGRYGEISKVDPRIAWPTKADLELKREYESVAYPSTIQEMLAEEVKKIEERDKELLKKDQQIAANLLKMDAWKKELRDKLSKKQSVAIEAKKKRERLIEEVRRHFGFSVDPREERFQKMIEAKEKEEKKALKEAKKKARHDEMVQQMLKMADVDKKEREAKASKTKEQ